MGSPLPQEEAWAHVASHGQGPEGSLRSLGLVLRVSLAEWEGQGLLNPFYS